MKLKFSADANPFGLSCEDHAKNYWKWILYLPKHKNPLKILLEKCTNGQTNSKLISILSSGGGGGIHIPFGKDVLIPVLIVEFSDKEVPNLPPKELSRLTKIDQDHVWSLVLEINGKNNWWEISDGIVNARIQLSYFSLSRGSS